MEFFRGRDWDGVGLDEFVAALGDYLSWYDSGRLKGFRDGGGARRYERRSTEGAGGSASLHRGRMSPRKCPHPRARSFSGTDNVDVRHKVDA